LTEVENLKKVGPPGHKFNVYNQIMFLYFNYLDVRFPVTMATELIPRAHPKPPVKPTVKIEEEHSIGIGSEDEIFYNVPNSTKKPSKPASTMFPDHLSCCSRLALVDDILLWACGPDFRTLGGDLNILLL